MAAAALVVSTAAAAVHWMAPAANAVERQSVADKDRDGSGDTDSTGSAGWRSTRAALPQRATTAPARRGKSGSKASTASRGSGDDSKPQRRAARWQPSRSRRVAVAEPSRPTKHHVIQLAQDTSTQPDPFDEIFDSPSSKTPGPSDTAPSAQTPSPAEATPPSDELPAPSNQPGTSTAPDASSSPGSSSDQSDLFSEESSSPGEAGQPAPAQEQPMVVTPRTDRQDPFADDPTATADDRATDTHPMDDRTSDNHATDEPTSDKSPDTLQLDAAGPPPAELPMPEPMADNESRATALSDCQEALNELRAEKLSDIVLSVSVKGRPGEDIPYECSLSDEPFEPRLWAETIYTWKASGACHKPLYFEDVQLERYGHSWGPYAQPFVSGAHFFATLPILPYKMGLKPPDECVYVLGHYRPGNCAPYLIDPVPLSWRAALLEAGAVVGVSAVVP